MYNCVKHRGLVKWECARRPNAKGDPACHQVSPTTGHCLVSSQFVVLLTINILVRKKYQKNLDQVF